MQFSPRLAETKLCELVLTPPQWSMKEVILSIFGE